MNDLWSVRSPCTVGTATTTHIHPRAHTQARSDPDFLAARASLVCLCVLYVHDADFGFRILLLKCRQRVRLRCGHLQPQNGLDRLH